MTEAHREEGWLGLRALEHRDRCRCPVHHRRGILLVQVQGFIIIIIDFILITLACNAEAWNGVIKSSSVGYGFGVEWLGGREWEVRG